MGVIDTFNFFSILSEVETVKAREQFLGPEEQQAEEDEGTVVQLLIDQIEFANVILLNKVDLLKPENKDATIKEIRNIVAKLNPKATVIVPDQPKFEDFPVEKLINTNAFNMEEASTSAGWLAELAKPAHIPETEEYGISSIVFRANDRPFHPKRLYDILDGFGQLDIVTGEGAAKEDQIFAGVVRAKGQLWLANADACPIDFHSAGRQVELTPNVEQPWIAKLIEDFPDGDQENSMT